MKKINYLLLSILFLIVSCGDIGKALRNEKTRTTDEFLVKKRGPLVLPPDYEIIPEPDTQANRDDVNQKDKIKEILKAPEINKKNENRKKSIENSILEKIKK